MSTVKSSAESQAGVLSTTSPETILSMSRAVTHLTATATQMAPVFSLAPVAPGREQLHQESVSEEDTGSKVTDKEEPKSEGDTGGSARDTSSMEPPAHQKSVEEEEESGEGAAGVNGGKKSPRKDSSEDDALDPVMRKYMQLVQEKRQQAKTGQVYVCTCT